MDIDTSNQQSCSAVSAFYPMIGLAVAIRSRCANVVSRWLLVGGASRGGFRLNGCPHRRVLRPILSAFLHEGNDASSRHHQKTTKEPIGSGRIYRIIHQKGNSKKNMAVVKGFFTNKQDVRTHRGKLVVIPSTNDQGSIQERFAKDGRCRVSFPNGFTAEKGDVAELYDAAGPVDDSN